MMSRFGRRRILIQRRLWRKGSRFIPVDEPEILQRIPMHFWVGRWGGLSDWNELVVREDAVRRSPISTDEAEGVSHSTQGLKAR